MTTSTATTTEIKPTTTTASNHKVFNGIVCA
jgi:hypothetical protein